MDYVDTGKVSSEIQWEEIGGVTIPKKPEPKTNGLALASMICGIAGCCVGPIVGIAAIVLGAIGLSQINKEPDKFTGKGMAITGIIMGILGIIWYILFIILYFALFAASLSMEP